MENISDIKLSVDFRDKNGNIVSPNLVPFDLIIKSTYRATLKTASFDGATFTNCLVRNNRLIIGLSKSSWDKGIDAKMYLHYSDSDMLDDGVYTHELDIVFRESINIDNNRQVAGTVTSDVSATVIYEITGKAGRSAYEDVIAKGMFYGTFEEWIDTLRQPALDAQIDANALMVTFGENEDTRTANEDSRNEAELLREGAEQVRETTFAANEDSRATTFTDNEQDRQDLFEGNEELRNTSFTTNEDIRKDNEDTRILNEDERIRLEDIRKDNELERERLEALRVTAEENRDSKETERLNAELDRISAENIRLSNEIDRIAREQIVLDNENERIRKENIRITNELARISAENIRKSDELTRQQQESTRQQQEANRNTTFNNSQTVRTTEFNNSETTRQNTFSTNEAIRNVNEFGNGVDIIGRVDAEAQRRADELLRQATIAGLNNTFNTKIDKTSITQELGTDSTKVMSQKGVNNLIKSLVNVEGEEVYAYGVKWDTTDATSTNATLTRVGNPHLHKTLPAHYWRKCLVKDDKTINYYLDDNNSNLNENGSPAVLDGSQGQIMSEVKFYFKTYKEGNWMFNWMSTQPLKGYTLYHNFIGSEEASIERATGKIFSCVNNTAEFRGGNNQTAYDNTGADVRGCAVTVKTIADFRTGGRLNRDVSWNGNTSERQRFGLLIAFRVAFATHNSQLPFNPNRTIEGYLQGGLGVGVTNLDNTKWGDYNGRYPFIPNGYANEFGIKCGVKNFIMPYLYDADLNKYKGVYDNGTIYQIGDFVSNKEDAFKGSGDGTLYKCILTSIAGVDLTNTAYFTQVVRTTTYPFSFFGIRDIFGHIWEGLSDVILKNDSVLNTSKVYIFKDPSKIVGSINSDTTFLCDFPTSNGYIKDFNISSYLPLTIGGGTTTYGCDYVYTDISQVERGFFVGGSANFPSAAGFACVISNYSVATANANFGGRLCLQIDNNTIIK